MEPNRRSSLVVTTEKHPMALAQTIRSLWQKLIAPAAPTFSETIVHDPDAAKPHDLDDPFFDQKVRERTASIIARAATK
jgi:hypothetical protein